MTISNNSPVSITLPTDHSDTDVWGPELNTALSTAVNALNQAINDIKDLQTQLNTANGVIAALTGGVNLTLLTADMLGQPNGIAQLDSQGYLVQEQAVFR